MSGLKSTVLANGRSRAAFVSSDDWTNVQNPVHRRKIQNRIAQRNYRRKIKKKLQELESRRSGRSDVAEKTIDVSAVEPSSESRSATATTASSLSARPQFESAQNHSPTLWQQRSEATSNVLPPVSYSLMMLPGFGCDGIAQSGYRALCAQCSLPLPWPGTAGSSGPECNIWASLAGKTSGPFDEGYAAMNQSQWPGAGSVRGAEGDL